MSSESVTERKHVVYESLLASLIALDAMPAGETKKQQCYVHCTHYQERTNEILYRASGSPLHGQ